VLGALIVIARLRAARACDPGGMPSRLTQQGCQYSGPSAVQPGTGGHLDGFQIQTSVLALGRKHYLKNRLDFPCDFLMYSSSRFFSASVQLPASAAAERDRQISSLTAVNSAVKS